jgi:hypothetical protein
MEDVQRPSLARPLCHDPDVAKYDPLFEHLCRAPDGPLEVSFADIDALVGGLPKSARRFTSWWANEVDATHAQARAWINASREVAKVDLAAERVTFAAARWARGS